MAAALKRFASEIPLMYAATMENADDMAKLAVAHACPIAAKVDGVADLADLSARLKDAGVDKIILDPESRTPQQSLEQQVHIRRAAVYKKAPPPGISHTMDTVKINVHAIFIMALFIQQLKLSLIWQLSDVVHISIKNCISISFTVTIVETVL